MRPSWKPFEFCPFVLSKNLQLISYWTYRNVALKTEADSSYNLHSHVPTCACLLMQRTDTTISLYEKEELKLIRGPRSVWCLYIVCHGHSATAYTLNIKFLHQLHENKVGVHKLSIFQVTGNEAEWTWNGFSVVTSKTNKIPVTRVYIKRCTASKRKMGLTKLLWNKVKLTEIVPTVFK